MRRKIKIRPLSEKDYLDVYFWRNHPKSRENSLRSEKINLNEHSRWFQKILNCKKNYYFIFYFKKDKIGLVRYDQFNHSTFITSILVNPIFQGQGFGLEMLLKSQEVIKKNNVEKLYARIRKKNKLSISVFEKANYIKYKEYDRYFLYCNKINKKV